MNMEDERTTQEVMETLAGDFERCHAALIEQFDIAKETGLKPHESDYEFYARQLIRAIFAYIEAVTFSVCLLYTSDAADE